MCVISTALVTKVSYDALIALGKFTARSGYSTLHSSIQKFGEFHSKVGEFNIKSKELDLHVLLIHLYTPHIKYRPFTYNWWGPQLSIPVGNHSFTAKALRPTASAGNLTRRTQRLTWSNAIIAQDGKDSSKSLQYGKESLILAFPCFVKVPLRVRQR